MRTEHGFDRLVNFSDAVVAIAITLLILPLVEIAKDVAHTDVGSLIAENWYSIFAFVLSFVVIGRFWIMHHSFYEHVSGYNRQLVWANLLWLLSIAFLPFPTALLAETGSSSPLVTGLYIGTMTVTSGAMVLQSWILRRHTDLRAPGAVDGMSLRSGLTTLVVLFTAGVIGVLVPNIGVASLLLLVVTGVIGRRGRASAPRHV